MGAEAPRPIQPLHLVHQAMGAKQFQIAVQGHPVHLFAKAPLDFLMGKGQPLCPEKGEKLFPKGSGPKPPTLKVFGDGHGFATENPHCRQMGAAPSERRKARKALALGFVEFVPSPATVGISVPGSSR